MKFEEELQLIQEKLDQLSIQQLELIKQHQQQVKSHEQQKTLYQKIFGQPPLPLDPKLESINTQIADLERDKENYLLRASVRPPTLAPEKVDWSNSLFYSKTVEKVVGANTPFEQYGLYGSTIGGVYLISRSLFRSYHALKAVKFPPESQERMFHSFLAGATGEQIRHAQIFAYQLRKRGFLGGILLPIGFITYIVEKHKE